jgi:hypothetical protein
MAIHKKSRTILCTKINSIGFWITRDISDYTYQEGNPQSSSTLWNYGKCGVYTVESEAGCSQAMLACFHVQVQYAGQLQL